jgi:hypothetical protein
VNRPENDADHEAWFRREASLHEQLAKLDRSEPPEELDRIVLERARAAIHTPRAVRPIRQLRWTVPVALAATLVLTFAILLRVMPQGTSALPTAPAPQAAEDGAADGRFQDQAVSAEAREEIGAAASTGAQPPPSPAALERPARLEQRAKRTTAAEPMVARSMRLESEAAADAVAPADSSVTPEVRADADAWLAAIARLRADGLEAEANEEMEWFRRTFPDRSAPAAAVSTAPDR